MLLDIVWEITHVCLHALGLHENRPADLIKRIVLIIDAAVRVGHAVLTLFLSLGRADDGVVARRRHCV